MKRKNDIHKLVTDEPPAPLQAIMAQLGMTERAVRIVIKDLEKEHGFQYFNTPAASGANDMPYGLTDATNRVRATLANELYRLTNDNNQFGCLGREEAAALTGLNPRAQKRAEEKPFKHDWSLSEIERLARALGEEPWDFMMRVLTT